MNYKKLNENFNTTYTINNKQVKIGHLNDNQLDISERILKGNIKPSTEQLKQLNAIGYIKKHNASKSLKQLENDVSDHMNRRLMSKAFKTALHIESWIEKSFK